MNLTRPGQLVQNLLKALIDLQTSAIGPSSGNVYVGLIQTTTAYIYFLQAAIILDHGEEKLAQKMDFLFPPVVWTIHLAGNVVVADTGNNRIQILSPTGNYLGSW